MFVRAALPMPNRRHRVCPPVAMRLVALICLGLLTIAPPAMAQDAAVPRALAMAFSTAVASGNADAVADLYVTDATLFAPGEAPVAGRAAIRALWARNIAAGFTDLQFHDLATDVGTDRAVVVWTWRLNAPATGQAVAGRSMVYLALTPQGWRISADMWQPGP